MVTVSLLPDIAGMVMEVMGSAIKVEFSVSMVSTKPPLESYLTVVIVSWRQSLLLSYV